VVEIVQGILSFPTLVAFSFFGRLGFVLGS
jgi:hypothetical protein